MTRERFAKQKPLKGINMACCLHVTTETANLMRTLKAGADGYLTKDSDPEKLLEAIRKVYGGGKYISMELAEQLAIEIQKGPENSSHEILSDPQPRKLRHQPPLCGRRADPNSVHAHRLEAEAGDAHTARQLTR